MCREGGREGGRKGGREGGREGREKHQHPILLPQIKKKRRRREKGKSSQSISYKHTCKFRRCSLWQAKGSEQYSWNEQVGNGKEEK